MKKITFVLFALITGTTFAQNRATESATTFAEIVEPLTISNIDNSQLSFGRIISTETGGSVTIDHSSAGERTIDNDMNAPGGVTSSAKFSITGSSYKYTIDLNATELKYQGSSTEGNTTSLTLTPEGNFEENSGNQTLYVGGTLSIGGNQTAGEYAGEVQVTVSYE